MTIHLIKDGVTVLTAKSSHRLGNSLSVLPITFEGNVNMLPDGFSESNVNMLESIFSLLARRHGFEVAGDYEEIMTKYNVKGFDQESRPR